MKEIWNGMIYNNIDYSNKFKISTFGNVYSEYSKKLIKPHIDQNGYYRFVTVIDRKKKNFGIHRAVACTFIPNPNNLPMVNHKDGIKTNNYAGTPENNFTDGNLEWCNNQENITHAIKNNLTNNKGEHNGNHKLTKLDVLFIRENYIPYDRNFGTRALAKKFQISKTTILHIIQNKIWKD